MHIMLLVIPINRDAYHLSLYHVCGHCGDNKGFKVLIVHIVDLSSVPSITYALPITDSSET